MNCIYSSSNNTQVQPWCFFNVLLLNFCLSDIFKETRFNRFFGATFQALTHSSLKCFFYNMVYILLVIIPLYLIFYNTCYLALFISLRYIADQRKLHLLLTTDNARINTRPSNVFFQIYLRPLFKLSH